MVAACYLSSVQVDRQVRDFEHRRNARARPTGERFHPRQQLLECKRLGDVIVGAGAQRFNLRIDGVLRGQDQNWSIKAASPEIVEDLCAGFPWKAHVQNHDIVYFRYCPGFTVVAVGDQVYAPALLLKAPFDELSDGGIVFYYEDFHRARLTSCGEYKGRTHCPPFEKLHHRNSAFNEANQPPGNCAHDPCCTAILLDDCLASAAS